MLERVYPDARIDRVKDGDTLRISVTVDIGFNVSASAKIDVRLMGANCEELKSTDPEAMAKALAAKEFIEKFALMPCKIITYKRPKSENTDEREKYGRYLATITVNGHDKSLNQQLLDMRLESEQK